MKANSPAVKLLMNFRKEWLVIKAEELNLPTGGTKLALAKRVAQKEDNETIRIWNAIANPKRR